MMATTDDDYGAELCPGCGATSDLWTSPVARGDEHYCCVGCADGRPCTCAAMITPEGAPLPR
jgi:hypothetical protein